MPEVTIIKYSDSVAVVICLLKSTSKPIKNAKFLVLIKVNSQSTAMYTTQTLNNY